MDLEYVLFSGYNIEPLHVLRKNSNRDFKIYVLQIFSIVFLSRRIHIVRSLQGSQSRGAASNAGKSAKSVGKDAADSAQGAAQKASKKAESTAEDAKAKASSASNTASEKASEAKSAAQSKASQLQKDAEPALQKVDSCFSLYFHQ